MRLLSLRRSGGRQARSPAAKTSNASGQTLHVHLFVPLGDGGHEPCDLVALVLVVKPVHLSGQTALHGLVRRQLVQRLAQRHRQLLDILALGHRRIDVALFRLARIQVVLQPVIHRRQQGGAHQIGVHHRIHRPILEPPRRRHAQPRGAVLEAPVAEDRRPEARIPQPPIRVHRRTADRGQRLQVMHHAADRLQTFLARHLRIVRIGHERVLAALHIHVVVGHPRQVVRIVAAADELVLATAPQAHVVMAARGRHPHERLGHETGEDPVFARHLRTDLAIGGQPVRVAQHVIEHPVQLKLPRRVLVIPLDHVQTHLAGIADHLQRHGPQAFELVDVIAIRLREPVPRLAVLVELQPHHLGLGADPQLGAVLLGEFLVQTAQVAPAIRRQIPAGIFLFLPVAEQRAVKPADLGRPGQLHEGFRLGNADQLGRLGPIAHVIARAVGEQVHRGAVNQLEPLLGDTFPVIRRNTLAHDLAGDRHELQVKILDPQLVDLLAHLLDLFVAPRRLYESFQICLSHFQSP
mmetsp:Transcript_23311/g.40480  ORF Transcript_23311/g.40480 Transcript_23311/m.40480 type:complete len:522 (-) Transcript_23311:58-1623(-)